MKNSKTNLLMNILIGLLLICALGAVGFMGYTIFNNNKKVEVPDFLGKDKETVFEWCGQLDSKYACEILFEPSKNVEKDIVFKQSLNAGSTLEETITFTICSEMIKPLALPQLYEAKKEDIEKWAADNNVLSVTYIEESSDTISKGMVIRIEPSDTIYYDTPVNVYLSSGKQINPEETIEIKSSEYINLTVAKFEEQMDNLGLLANHDSSKDKYSSSVSKGNIVWHGSGSYKYGESINYGICIDETKDDSIYIKAGTYIGKSEEEFIKIAKELGLSPNHNSSRDAYSDDVAKGNIVWHGYGYYEKNETFNYGLSLGKKDESSSDIVVKSGTYIGKSEDEFIKIGKDLGLSPNHKESKDAYSDTVAKGCIVWHGSGTYVKNETFNYGLSLGKAQENTSITLTDQSGKSESSFKSYIESLGLVLGTRKEDYSSTVAEGNIISHDTGTFKKGDKINYIVSLGKNIEYGAIMRPERYSVGDTFDATKKAMQEYLSVFTNAEYIGVTSTRGVGKIEKIEVGSYGSSYEAGNYPVDTPIKVYIVNQQSN